MINLTFVASVVMKACSLRFIVNFSSKIEKRYNGCINLPGKFCYMCEQQATLQNVISSVCLAETVKQALHYYYSSHVAD